MSSLAFVGEVMGYNGGDSCSPCGSNRRQVVNTLNGLYGDVTITIDGYTAVIEGNTIHYVGGSTSTSNQVAGTEPIANGASEVAVVFDTPFDAVPIITGALVLKGDPDDPDVTFSGIKNLTASGFTAVLLGAVPNGNYTLHWEAQEAIAVIPTGDATFDSEIITFDSELITWDSL